VFARVSTQVAPRNISGSAPSTLLVRSRPSDGPDETGVPDGVDDALLVPATSLTTLMSGRPGPGWLSCSESTARAMAATAPAGTAMKVTAASRSTPTRSMAPSFTARSALAASRSVPLTHQPCRRSAIPMEPPMSPVPITAARGFSPAGVLFGKVIS